MAEVNNNPFLQAIDNSSLDWVDITKKEWENNILQNKDKILLWITDKNMKLKFEQKFNTISEHFKQQKNIIFETTKNDLKEFLNIFSNIDNDLTASLNEIKDNIKKPLVEVIALVESLTVTLNQAKNKLVDETKIEAKREAKEDAKREISNMKDNEIDALIPHPVLNEINILEKREREAEFDWDKDDVKDLNNYLEEIKKEALEEIISNILAKNEEKNEDKLLWRLEDLESTFNDIEAKAEDEAKALKLKFDESTDKDKFVTEEFAKVKDSVKIKLSDVEMYDNLNLVEISATNLYAKAKLDIKMNDYLDQVKISATNLAKAKVIAEALSEVEAEALALFLSLALYKLSTKIKDKPKVTIN